MQQTRHPRCILVTGPGHSGTRLLVRMLDRHPDVSVPMAALNYVGEFAPAHQFFVQVLDRTPLYADCYEIDFEELRYVMDAYMLNVDPSRPYCLFKLPHYVLSCVDFFVDYFQGNLVLLYTQRPVEKIVRSFLQRKEDFLFFKRTSMDILRQIKKIDLSRRMHYLATGDAEGFFAELVYDCDRRRDAWNEQHPETPLLSVDVEQLATSRSYLAGVLVQIGLGDEHVDRVAEVLDADRLLHHKSARKRSRLVRWADALTPGFLRGTPKPTNENGRKAA